MRAVMHNTAEKYPGKVVENNRKQTSMETLQDIDVFPLQEQGETALHLAVRLVDRTSLHIVDFLTQNR